MEFKIAHEQPKHLLNDDLHRRVLGGFKKRGQDLDSPEQGPPEAAFETELPRTGP